MGQISNFVNGTSFTVESGIPVPPSKRRAKSTYPWERMRLNDSFFVETPKGKSHRKTAKQVQSQGIAWLRQRKIDHVSVVSRLTAKDFGGEKGSVKGVRIWFIDRHAGPTNSAQFTTESETHERNSLIEPTNSNEIEEYNDG